jgi:hypothetical protein
MKRHLGVLAACGSLAAAVTLSAGAHPAVGPTVTKFSPARGPAGTAITVWGNHLAGARVLFRTQVAKNVKVNATGTKAIVDVPTGLNIGPAVVKLTTQGGTVKAKQTFDVTAFP